MKMIQFFNFTVALCFSILLLSFIQLFFYPLGIKNKESLVLCDIGFSIPEGIGENLQEGKTLFKANCQSCHARNMRSKSTG
ncbi:MAG: c-type cytochrome, partial [Saprospiraceae bacterium]